MAELLPESEFHQRVDALIMRIESELETQDDDIDFDAQSGILTIDCDACDDGIGKIIINRQTPNREVWVAAKSGGFHFRWDGAAWRDTRSHEQLESLLSRVLSAQSGKVISITL